MVRSKMALTASTGQPGKFYRRCVSCMTGGGIAARAVVVRFADPMAAGASAFDGCVAFNGRQSVGRAFHPAGLILFRKGHLFRCEVFVTADRGPGSSCMPAVQELLVDRFMAAA